MDMLLFDNVEKLGRIILTAIMVYILIVLITKVFGKRSTSQLNNFDWIVTVMIGSLSAGTILRKEVPLIEGSAAIVTLYFLQFLVTKCSSVFPDFGRLILSEPRIVFYRGQYLPEAMHAERLTRQELESAMRSKGINSLDVIEAIVLESDATLTIIQKPTPSNSKNDDQQNINSVSETIKPLMSNDD
ncbi:MULTISPECIES: DUF421 domain-containing protein [unclassified Psychrobacter]|uniref:DUF421 domain-containing protein n=1 Tax=unclassified Psychrobacter TaxID=196806 RepID=UPI0025D1F138|nr:MULTISPECIES: YetF domain-containing protein [unclassified Psychrobacter]